MQSLRAQKEIFIYGRKIKSLSMTNLPLALVLPCYCKLNDYVSILCPSEKMLTVDIVKENQYCT